MADTSNIPIPLSRLCRSPILRAFFERAEKEDGAAFAVPAPAPKILTGGAVAVREVAYA